jgi:putative two-component system response regulator
MNNVDQAIILVVDDNPMNLDVLLHVFEHTEYDMLFASDGNTCLQLAEDERPNLILLDVMMPGIDGFETCRRLKANEQTRQIPVIFMTALADTMNKVKGLDLGAVDYITKPIQPEEVLARVKTHLTLERLQTELQAKNVELQAKNAELQAKNAMLADREVHLTHLVESKTKKIENITLSLENANLSLVNALENANLSYDLDTGRHIRRVSAYSAFLAEQYGCDRDFVKRINLYASLHDVGKVGLAHSILKKPGKYTPDEFELMQQHVIIGARILESEAIDTMAKNIALYHHEKWDGTGYVHHLSGEAIPLEARIVALSDVYDALTTDRVYKAAFSEEESERIIAEKVGTHFDPKLVEIFFSYRQAIRDIKKSLT